MRLSFENKKRGFTLVELVTALGLFIAIMTISLGSILGIFAANSKSRSLKTVMGNLNLTVETMSKEMRYGKKYHCGAGTLTTPQDCANGDTLVSFLSTEGEQITYRFINNTIEKKVESGEYVGISAPEAVIDSAQFYVFGATVGDTFQPKMIVKIQGHVDSGKSRSDFTLQTMVSQRSIDI